VRAGAHIAPSVPRPCAVDKAFGYRQAAGGALWHARERRKPSQHPATARSARAGAGEGCLVPAANNLLINIGVINSYVRHKNFAKSHDWLVRERGYFTGRELRQQ